MKDPTSNIKHLTRSQDSQSTRLSKCGTTLRSIFTNKIRLNFFVTSGGFSFRVHQSRPTGPAHQESFPKVWCLYADIIVMLIKVDWVSERLSRKYSFETFNLSRCKPNVAVANLFRIFDVEGNFLVKTLVLEMSSVMYSNSRAQWNYICYLQWQRCYL